MEHWEIDYTINRVLIRFMELRRDGKLDRDFIVEEARREVLNNLKLPKHPPYQNGYGDGDFLEDEYKAPHPFISDLYAYCKARGAPIDERVDRAPMDLLNEINIARNAIGDVVIEKCHILHI